MPPLPRSRRATRFVYPYSEVPTRRGNVVLRPMVSARVSWKSPPKVLSMLVDTGADDSFLPAGIAEDLGLPPSGSRKEIEPIGPAFWARPHKLSLQLVSSEGKSGEAHEMDIYVPESRGLLKDPILGQKPLLDWYELTVRKFAREFVLREI